MANTLFLACTRDETWFCRRITEAPSCPPHRLYSWHLNLGGVFWTNDPALHSRRRLAQQCAGRTDPSPHLHFRLPSRCHPFGSPMSVRLDIHCWRRWPRRARPGGEGPAPCCAALHALNGVCDCALWHGKSCGGRDSCAEQDEEVQAVHFLYPLASLRIKLTPIGTCRLRSVAHLGQDYR